jgi:hypothetical protein
LEALAVLPADRAAVDPQSRILLAGEIGSTSRIYLERLDIAFPGDSGWYIGRADEGAGVPDGSMEVGDLLNARADLTDILTLPKGYLAVLDGGGVVAVIGPRDEDLWKAPGSPTEAAPQTAEAAQPAPVESTPEPAAPAT